MVRKNQMKNLYENYNPVTLLSSRDSLAYLLSASGASLTLMVSALKKSRAL